MLKICEVCTHSNHHQSQRFFFLSHRMKWLKVQLLPLNGMPVIIPSGFPNNLLLRVCTHGQREYFVQPKNTTKWPTRSQTHIQGPWVSRTLTTMPQHFLITDKPFAFCKVPKQFSSTHLPFYILQKGHRTQKGQNKVTVTSSWLLL